MIMINRRRWESKGRSLRNEMISLKDQSDIISAPKAIALQRQITPKKNAIS
jgi:hypothetical protein